MKLFILPNFGKERTGECLRTIQKTLEGCGCELVVQPMRRNRAADGVSAYRSDLGEMIESCDAVIAIGGDGTMMHAAKFAAEADKPVLGVNTGRLGFLTGLEASELGLITRLISGDYTIESRMMLDIEIIREGTVKSIRHAINDAVVSRGSLSRIIDLSVMHNGRRAIELRADGLIVSTPTGSTAYAMSAGGPMIDPAFRCIEVTPVCPHSLMDRSIIFDGESELVIEARRRGDDLVEAPGDGVRVSVDGETAVPLATDETIRVRPSSLSADFIIIKKQSFANALLGKFIN